MYSYSIGERLVLLDRPPRAEEQVLTLLTSEELDRQPVQGENIRTGKQEIEKTLDTLNLAFEKLLDSLFEDTAWDVATDIAVLQTMLAQEGLTEQKLKAVSPEKER